MGFGFGAPSAGGGGEAMMGEVGATEILGERSALYPTSLQKLPCSPCT